VLGTVGQVPAGKLPGIPTNTMFQTWPVQLPHCVLREIHGLVLPALSHADTITARGCATRERQVTGRIVLRHRLTVWRADTVPRNTVHVSRASQ